MKSSEVKRFAALYERHFTESGYLYVYSRVNAP